MKISMRGWVLPVGIAMTAVIVAFCVPLMLKAAEPATEQLTTESLGQTLRSLGLKPKLVEKRYDFNFRTKYDGEEWELSMSAVLSKDGQSLWLMAWLDELPTSADEVPRAALMRLLADNDRIGRGRFFAYIPGNRRFVLEQALENRDIDGAHIRSTLLELGSSVVDTYPHWNVANWTPSGTSDAATTASATDADQGEIRPTSQSSDE